MSKPCFFITGTGTDVGKTFVTAGIALKCVEAGIKTALVKPVQTGTDDYPADVTTISRMVDGLYPLPHDTAVPFEFKFAASPHLAARLENRPLSTADVVAACRRAETVPGPELLLFEGAGGLYVPLNGHDTMLDLIRELNYPVILVCPTGLGAINYAMLSVMALRNCGAKIAGIVFNGMPEQPDPIAEDNINTIARMSGVPILATIPRLHGRIDQPRLSLAFAGLDVKNMLA